MNYNYSERKKFIKLTKSPYEEELWIDANAIESFLDSTNGKTTLRTKSGIVYRVCESIKEIFSLIGDK